MNREDRHDSKTVHLDWLLHGLIFRGLFVPGFVALHCAFGSVDTLAAVVVVCRVSTMVVVACLVSMVAVAVGMSWCRMGFEVCRVDLGLVPDRRG